MNTKRIFFWLCFVIVLALIIWGMIVALNKAPAANNGYGTIAPVTAADHVRGPANAPVTLVEYSDFQCPACEQYYPIVERVMASSSATLRMVYRHYPLPQHPNAVPAAIASEAASNQGKFWEMYHLLFQNHTDWTELGDAKPVFDTYAAKIGLDVARFDADMNSTTTKTIVQAASDEAQRLALDHTPTFFLNGRYLDNPQSYDAFISAVQAAASSSPN